MYTSLSRLNAGFKETPGQNNQISVFQVSGRLFEVRRLFETESLCY